MLQTLGLHCLAAVDGAKGLHRLGNTLDWDAAWECLGINKAHLQREVAKPHQNPQK